MPAKVKLKRKSYFVDERALNRAKKALGAKSESEVIRLAVERVAEMAEFWDFMNKSRRSLRPGSVARGKREHSAFSTRPESKAAASCLH